MNKRHLELCSSDEWADSVKRYIIPGALKGVDIGDDVLEIGPGPGRTTEIIKDLTKQLTAVEIDDALADALTARMAGTNVTVVHGDGTDLPFPDGRFTAALSFTMMHHVPSPEQQDMLFAQARRVLRPDGVFAGVDSLDTPAWREHHIDDICVPLLPDTLEGRLRAAGFSDVRVELNPYVLQWSARP